MENKHLNEAFVLSEKMSINSLLSFTSPSINIDNRLRCREPFGII